MTKRESIIHKRGYHPEIAGDELSLYIANYPKSADYLAARIGDPHKTVLELCCGVGITLQKLAQKFNHATGVDIKQSVLNDCEKNIKKAGLDSKVTLIQGDASSEDFLKTLQADIVIYDIPYWDMGISQHHHSSQENPDLKKTIKVIQQNITKDIVIFAPPHYSYTQAKEDFGDCEYQAIYRHEHERTYIYLGTLIQTTGQRTLYLN